MATAARLSVVHSIWNMLPCCEGRAGKREWGVTQQGEGGWVWLKAQRAVPVVGRCTYLDVVHEAEHGEKDAEDLHIEGKAGRGKARGCDAGEGGSWRRCGERTCTRGRVC